METPGVALNPFVNRNIYCSFRKSTHVSSVVYPVACGHYNGSLPRALYHIVLLPFSLLLVIYSSFLLVVTLLLAVAVVAIVVAAYSM